MIADSELTLVQIQSWMQSALVRPASENLTGDTGQLVNASSRLTAERHLQIYRQSYIARLRECMKNQFSALAYALGEDLFQMFADQYLEAYPSGSYTLNELGAGFPRFLEETRPDAGEAEKESWIDFMIELAEFEYALSVIFDAEPEENFRPAVESTPDAELKLIPTFQIFYYRYPVSRYYLDVTGKKEPELPFEEDSFCAVTRNDNRLRLTHLKPGQYYFLEQIAKGKSIAEAKQYFIEAHDVEADRIEKLWQHWKKAFIEAGYFQVNTEENVF